MASRLDPEILGRLERDVRRTVGTRHVHLVAEQAALAAALESNDLEAKVVEDVQQVIHDTFIDTTWPTCPHHRRHPLWFRDGAWWCEESAVQVAALGDLPPSS